MSDFE